MACCVSSSAGNADDVELAWILEGGLEEANLFDFVEVILRLRPRDVANALSEELTLVAFIGTTLATVRKLVKKRTF